VSPQFPPRPSKRVTVALAVIALVTFLYSIVIVGQILLWFALAGFAVGLYLIYLLIVAVFRLVAAVERIATAAEVDSGIRTAAEARQSAPPTDGTGAGARASDVPASAPDDGDASGSPNSERNAGGSVPRGSGAPSGDALPDDSADDTDSGDPADGG